LGAFRTDGVDFSDLDHYRGRSMNFTIESEVEGDGRWVAEVPELPGVLAYGADRNEAMSRAQVLALRVIADRLEHGEAFPQSIHMSVPA